MPFPFHSAPLEQATVMQPVIEANNAQLKCHVMPLPHQIKETQSRKKIRMLPNAICANSTCGSKTALQIKTQAVIPYQSFQDVGSISLRKGARKRVNRSQNASDHAVCPVHRGREKRKEKGKKKEIKRKEKEIKNQKHVEAHRIEICGLW